MADDVREAGGEDLVDDIALLLGRILAKTEITADSDFFRLGGDSLAAVNLMVAIEERFGIKVDPVVIFERPRISDFAFAIDWLLKNPG
jgi:acyl carrier protein